MNFLFYIFFINKKKKLIKKLILGLKILKISF